MSRGSVLILVEGDREQKFFQKLGSFLQDTSMTLVPFQCNIYALYREMKEYYFDIEIEKAIEYSHSIPSEEKEKLKEKTFEAKYLVFDLDFHVNSLSSEDKVKAIPQMLDAFDNDSENGLLFLNYPMFESIREKVQVDNNPPYLTFPIAQGKNYKQIVGDRGCSLDLKHHTLKTYCEYLKDSLSISNFLLGNPYRMPSKEEAERITSKAIWEKQKERIGKDQCVCCLNTSIQILMAYFGYDRVVEWMDKQEWPFPYKQ